jgi:hypothetical protein
MHFNVIFSLPKRLLEVDDIDIENVVFDAAPVVNA